MATNYFKAIHHHHHHHQSLRRRDSIDSPSPTSNCSFFFLKPTHHSLTSSSSSNNTVPFSIISNSTASSSTTNATSPSTSKIISFDLLHQHLSSQNFRQADEETRRLLILLAGEPAQKRGYVFFSEVQFISVDDLKAIDELWRKYSNNRFGYSVQMRIWNKVGRDFTKFFVQVGWMKKLETEVVQYGYRAFPEEFIWEMNEETNPPPPQGHLPLTNALRGTQLFSSILTHPAFGGDDDDGDEIDNDDDVTGAGKSSGNGGGGLISEPLTNKVFKADYTF